MPNLYPSVEFLNYSIYSDKLKKISFDDKLVINTINQYSFCIAEKDPAFKKALQQSDVLLPDGVGIVGAVKLLTGKSVKKISGSAIHDFLLEYLNNTRGKCFYLGSSPETLRRISDKIFLQHPFIQARFYSPPFADDFTTDDNRKMLEAINSFKPDVLFIGMTAPKQEKWSLKNKELIDAKLICSIGAVFDFYAGTIKRPHKFWVSVGLEWFIRLVKEPKRMWRRYLYYGPVFIFLVLKQGVKQLISRNFNDHNLQQP